MKKGHVQVHYWAMASLAVDNSCAGHSGEAENLSSPPKKICPANHPAHINRLPMSSFIYLSSCLLHAVMLI